MSRQLAKAYTEYLVMRAKTGDRAGFDLLARHYEKRLLAFAVRLTGDREMAREAAQEAWADMCVGLHKLSDTRAFNGWAYKIVSRKCVDQIRKSQKRRKIKDAIESEPIISGSTIDRAANLSDQQVILRLIADLPQDQRLTMILFYSEDLNVAEIAHIMDVPNGTVKSRLSLARNKIRAQLKGDDNV